MHRHATHCALSLFTIVSLACVGHSAPPAGGFYVHLNQQNTTGFSDSRRSLTFYDTDDLAAGPLFSVHLPGEDFEDGQNLDYNGEELDAIAADPLTGDVYVLSFDSTSGGMVGDAEMNTGTGVLDTLGTLDLYRIDFQAAYDHWSTNFEGRLAAGMPGVGGPTPFVPAGCGAGCTFDDYVTYGAGPVDSSGNFDPVNQSHSNAFVLPGVVQKIGEVKRNDNPSAFTHEYSLEFIDANTLVMIDDSSSNDDMANTDHEYRILARVSTAPGAADDSSADFLDGGFNNGTTESWNSRRIGFVHRDFADGLPTGHSEPESMAYFQDPLTQVRGFWVTESDGGGDDISFFEIDANGNGVGYREQAVGGGPDFPDSFALDNDPFVDPTTNDGKADHIFVDRDTGDLIIVESGFNDAADGITAVDHEPAVIRREVVSYDDGAGRIQFGAWFEKQITQPVKDPGDNAFLERGHWAAYNSDEDLVYFLNPGAGGETPSFQNDIMILDVNTGVTTTINNIDESVALFFSDSYGDVADYFFISAVVGNGGDYNDDGQVNAADYTIWRNNLNSSGAPGTVPGDGTTSGDLAGVPDGMVDQWDYDYWKQEFGTTIIGSAARVPEPSCSLLIAIAAGLFALATQLRREG